MLNKHNWKPDLSLSVEICLMLVVFAEFWLLAQILILSCPKNQNFKKLKWKQQTQALHNDFGLRRTKAFIKPTFFSRKALGWKIFSKPCQITESFLSDIFTWLVMLHSTVNPIDFLWEKQCLCSQHCQTVMPEPHHPGSTVKWCQALQTHEVRFPLSFFSAF